jgi:hypothetical protein
LSGHRIDAVSAMKCTPQKAMTRRRCGRLLREAERVADVVGHVLDLGQLVVVGEDDGVALAGERADLGLQLADPRRVSGAASQASEGWPWGGSWLALQDEREIEGRCRVRQRPTDT